MRKLFSGMLFLFILSSCASSPTVIYRLNTVGNNWEKRWLNGREFTKLEDDKVELVIAFDEIRGGLISFDIELLNKSRRTILVSNELFEMISLDAKGNTVDNKKNRQTAIDPEKVLIRLDLLEARENSQYENDKNSDAVFSLFELFADIAVISTAKTQKEKDKWIERSEKSRRENREREAEKEKEHNNFKFLLSDEKYKWKINALRKSSLLPGEKIQGKIFFNFNDKASIIKLKFINGDDTLVLLFNVLKYKYIYNEEK